MSNIFVSYSKEDKSIAKKLVSKLESDNLSCWIYPRNSDGNKNQKDFEEAIQNSEIFVLILSQFSEKSQDVAQQLNWAVDNNIPIIPFRTGKTSNNLAMQYFLHTVEWIDAYEDGFDASYEILTEIIDEISDGKIEKHIPKKRSDYNKKHSSSNSVEGLNKNYIIIGLVALVLLFAGLYFTKNPENNSNINTSKFNNSKIKSIQNKKINIPILHEDLSALNASDKKLAGTWRVIEYSDDQTITPKEKAELANYVKKNGAIIFYANKTFVRSGFSKNIEKGTWKFNEKDKQIFLTSNNKTGTMNLAQFTENRMTMLVVEQVKNDKNMTAETVTTKIVFEKQK